MASATEVFQECAWVMHSHHDFHYLFGVDNCVTNDRSFRTRSNLSGASDYLQGFFLAERALGGSVHVLILCIPCPCLHHINTVAISIPKAVDAPPGNDHQQNVRLPIAPMIAGDDLDRSGPTLGASCGVLPLVRVHRMSPGSGET